MTTNSMIIYHTFRDVAKNKIVKAYNRALIKHTYRPDQLFDAFLLYRSEYDDMPFYPDVYKDKSFHIPYLCLMLAEETIEVEVAKLSQNNYNLLEELSDYYILLRLIKKLGRTSKQPYAPLNFPVSHLYTIKSITKAGRYGLTKERVTSMHEYFTSHMNHQYFRYPSINARNLHVFLMGIHLVKGMIRFSRDHFTSSNIVDLNDDIRHLSASYCSTYRNMIGNKGYNDMVKILKVTADRVHK